MEEDNRKGMMRKTSALIIDNSVGITGALKAIVGFSLYAKPQIHFIFALPKGSKAVEVVKSQGFEVEELPFVEISKSWKKVATYPCALLANGYRIKKIVQQKRIDIVHVNDLYNMSAIVAKLIGGRFKLIAHVRFMPDRFPVQLLKIWIGANLKYAEAIICVSEAVRNLLPKHPKISVIYDGLLNSRISFQKENKNEEDVRLLYLGHYIPGKGQNLALKAVAKAYERNPKLKLKFVGGDLGLQKNKQFKAALIQKAKILNIHEVVIFAGPTNEVEKEILAADIVLNFSESESFSMTCLEALSLGVPLIATDCGGPAELFVHRESGWLVSNRDIQAMKEAIIQLSENIEIRKKLSINSPNFVKDKFADQKTFGRLSAMYHKVLNKS